MSGGGPLEIRPVHGGGKLSACYIIRCQSGNYLLKIRGGGIYAEHRALEAWRQKGARVVPVVASGVIPMTKHSPKPMKYLLIELISGSAGEIAPTGTDFVHENPVRVRSLGYQMGVELAKMHRAVTTKTFGEYADMWGKTAPYRSMNAYLMGYLDAHHQNLQKLGLSDEAIKLLREKIAKVRFVQRGRYIHGDFSLRNVLVKRSRPLSIVVIDPNPSIGDPAWDLAILYNNVDFARRRLIHNPTNQRAKKIYTCENECLTGLKKGYEETTRHRLNEVKIKACQLVQTIFLYDIEVNKAKRRHKRPEVQLEVMIRREAIMEHVNDFINILK